MHLAYLDDSDTKAKTRKWQVMAGVIIDDRVFTTTEMAMSSVRDELIAADKVEQFQEFHACELYGGYGVFQGIEQQRRFDAISKLLFCLEFAKLSVVYGAVDISALQNEVYGSADPLDMSFRMCVKGIQSWIDHTIVNGVIGTVKEPPDDMDKWKTIIGDLMVGWLRALVIVIVDEGNKQTRNSLQKSFRSLRSGLIANKELGELRHFHDDMYFGDSKYSIGIQLADLCSYFIARHLEGDAEVQGFYEMIKLHIIHSQIYPQEIVSEETAKAATNGK